jgi:hypothetical protein
LLGGLGGGSGRSGEGLRSGQSGDGCGCGGEGFVVGLLARLADGFGRGKLSVLSSMGRSGDSGNISSARVRTKSAEKMALADRR